MKNKALLLIHGMGTFTAPEAVPAKDDQPATTKPGSFGKEFITATTATLAPFAAYKTDSLVNHFDVHEFNYSVWFDKMRAEMAKNASSMSDRLAAISGIYGASIPFGLVERLTSLEAGFGKNSFFYTHWLDVIFYGTMLGEKVRADATAKLAQLFIDYDPSEVHIIAHSLGTACIHDTLQKAYRKPGEAGPAGGAPHQFDLVNQKLGSIWMFANVSRLVNSVTRLTDPLSSVVRPGDGGCTSTFVNVHHKLDPFTWLAPFDPQNDGHWVPEPIYGAKYTDIETDLVVDPNTHSFSQYLQDPAVSQKLLPFLLFPDFKGNAAETAAAAEARHNQSLPGKFAALEDALAKAIKSPDRVDGWKDFLTNAEALAAAVKQPGETFH